MGEKSADNMQKQSKFSIWFSTARPKTLALALASILVGSALAAWAGCFDGVTTSLAILTSVLLQILSNFANDYGDHLKGSDTKERIGPLRAIQQGQINGGQLKASLFVVGGLCLLSGLALIIHAYQTVQDVIIFSVLGLVSVLAAITYTVGRHAYGYLGLGDLSVLIFFGFVAVIGTFYLQAHTMPALIILPAFGCGLLSVAVLNINNLRDIYQDSKAGKNTLIVRIGSQKGRIYHLLLLLFAIISYLIFVVIELGSWYNFLFLLTTPLLIHHGRQVYHHQDPAELRPLLGQMAALALMTNLLFSLSVVL